MNKLLDLAFWFKVNPGLMDQRLFFIVMIFLLILAFFSLITYLATRRKKGLYTKVWSRLNIFFFSNLVIGSLLSFFSYETVPLLSSRFWWPLWGLSMLVWAYFIIRQLLTIPELRKQLDAEREYKKYLPQ